MPRPAYDERIQWSPNCHTRALDPIDFNALHTQEGDGTAASLANYLCNPNSKVSYHYTVDNARNAVCVVDTDDASWSVGNANHRVINICFAGSRAGWSRQQWLSHMGNAIEIAAWIAVTDAIKYRHDAVVRNWEELRAGKTGFTDHQGINECILKAKGHWDCGPNFPWDVYAGHVNRFRDELTGKVQVSMPQTTAIENCRAANEWLGNKVTPGREEMTPDGKGRYAHYENGSIYWSPRVDGGKAAFAVTSDIRDLWAVQGWERGPLGYPTKPKLDLVAFDRTSVEQHIRGGTVQAFEGGTVYASTLGTYVLKGLVKDRYASLRYETGDLGWPVSDEEPWGDANYGGATQRFEHGVIVWINKGDSTIALRTVGEVIFPLAETPPAVEAPKPVGYQPTDEERRLTPLDMRGGISFFAGPKDGSTTGRTMAMTGESADFPRDPWYCAMRFGYCQIKDDPNNAFWVKPVPGTSDLNLKQYATGCKLLVTNPANGKQVVVRPADWGPGAWGRRGGRYFRVLDVSETCIKQLGAVTDDQITVEWVDPSTPLGPR